MTLPDAGQIMRRLVEIDQALSGSEGNPGVYDRVQSAASAYYEKKRDWELAFATEYIEAEGSNQKERESKALVELAKKDVYKDFIKAEGSYEGAKAALRTLETRVGIGQSLLRVVAKEAGYQ